LEINALSPLPFIKPKPVETNEIEVVDEENIVTQELSVEPEGKEKLRTEKPKNSIKKKKAEDDEDEGQTKLFDE
jgi:hypothetical protein